ncbi:MAG: hypothetical protein HPY85_16515 [Anaerolineae bacterium]|nr:hypothetical protein [Anaerolineae bacterium]
MDNHNQQLAAAHYFRLLLAVIIIVLLPPVYGLFISYTTPDVETPPVSNQAVDDFLQVILDANDPQPASVPGPRGNSPIIPITLTIFHDLNLDGLQGDPELDGSQVRLYNAADYTDVRIFEEAVLTGDEVSLCYGISCKTPDENGQITFHLPAFVFERQASIPLWFNARPGRWQYYTFNLPNTIHGQLEGGTIILQPQFAGAGDINLPTQGQYTDFRIGFSEYPCVMPFDETAAAQLLPMNFYDFDSNLGSILGYDGRVPRTLREIDPAFGNYNSENHAGLDVYYPDNDRIIRYSCILPPTYLPQYSSDTFGNLVFQVSPGGTGSDFLVSFGHLAAPAVEGYPAPPLVFGQAFGTVGDKGSTINHLHFAFGYVNESRLGGRPDFCAVPPFPYLSGNPPYPGIMYGTSQLQEELCFNHTYRTHLSFVHDGDTIYTAFVPSMAVADAE